MPSKVIPWLKVLVHAFCLLPALSFVWQYRSGALAALADPVNALTHWTGDWALWLLLVDLAITPIRRLSPKLAWLIRFRRLLGLYSFFYATLHLSVYVFLFSGYDTATAVAGWQAHHYLEPWRQLKVIWPSMVDDVEKRRFIQVGLLAWLILLSLAITSPQRMLRWMGGRNWARLHRLIYLAGAAAVVHYWWLVKTGVRTPWKVTAILAVLLLARMVWWARKKFAEPRRPATAL
jgi:sulfoxide reductase heme-binding subunit YedZ